jgi:hypothetical protein
MPKEDNTYKTSQQELNAKNMCHEAESIIECALEGVSRIVATGPLVFFSSDTGDAWMLDSEDEMAVCLAKEYDPQPHTIMDRSGTFAISWNAHYSIQGEEFVVFEPSGRTRCIFGYPTGEIEAAIRAAR